MKKAIFIVIILATIILSGCKKGMLFPRASGRPYEVLVVMDTETWKAPTGRALFDVLDTDVPGLPQSERSFHISQVEPKHFSANLNIFRNIIQVNIDGQQFTQTRAIMAVVVAAVMAVIIYRMFRAGKGTVTIPGGWKFDWK